VAKSNSREDSVSPSERNNSSRCLWITLDYFIAPGVILFLLFDPNFLHGYIDFLETGQYLSGVNGIFEGKVPYKDFFVLFGPFQLYAIAAAMALFGKTIATFRMFFYLNYLLSFLAIYFLARQVCRRRSAVYLAVFVCLVEVSQPFWATSWDFGRMGLGMLVLLVLAAYARKEDKRLVFLAGILSGTTFFYTLDVGVIAILASLIFLSASSMQGPGVGRERISQALRLFLWYGGGGLLVAIPLFIFMALEGALVPYIETAFYVLPKYHMTVWGQAAPSFVEAVRNSPTILALVRKEVFRVYLPIFLYTGIFLYLVAFLLRKKWNTERSIFLLLFIFGVLAYKTAFRAIMGPQFQVVLPPLLILTVSLFERAHDALFVRDPETTQHARVGSKFLLKTVAFGMLAVAVGSYFLVSPKRYYGTLHGWLAYQQLKGELVATYSFPVPFHSLGLKESKVERIGKAMIPSWQEAQVAAVVEYLKKNTKEREEVFCYPEHGLYNFLAERPASTQFYIAGYAYTAPHWREKLLAQLSTHGPRIVVYNTEISNLAKSIGRREELFPDVTKFIERNYHVAEAFGTIRIYLRNS
jgi:hypothetical protein